MSLYAEWFNKLSERVFQPQGVRLPDQIYRPPKSIELPGADQVHVFLCRDRDITNDHLLPIFNTVLSAEEQQRMAHFRFARDRHQFLLTRVLCRYVLSGYFPDVAPIKWIFGQEEHGKPFIMEPRYRPLRFNLSHTTGLIAMAVCVRNEIGIDVETHDTAFDCSALTNLVLAPQERQRFLELAGQPQQQADYFFTLWTLKEAYLKATGIGMQISLDQIFFDADLEGVIQIQDKRPDIATPCWFEAFDASASQKMALAMVIEKPVAAIEIAVHYVNFQELLSTRKV